MSPWSPSRVMVEATLTSIAGVSKLALRQQKNADISLIAKCRRKFSAVDLAGDKARTLAAWTRRDGRAWFFKLTGPNGGG